MYYCAKRTFRHQNQDRPPDLTQMRFRHRRNVFNLTDGCVICVRIKPDLECTASLKINFQQEGVRKQNAGVIPKLCAARDPSHSVAAFHTPMGKARAAMEIKGLFMRAFCSV